MDELRETQQRRLEAIGRLSAGIAHEVNTPIQFIGDNLRFLESSFGEMVVLLGRFRSLLDSEEFKGLSSDLAKEIVEETKRLDFDFLMDEIPQAINQSLDGVNRVSSIVRAMKEFSHPGSTDMEPVNLNKAVESTLMVSRNEWKYVATLETSLSEALPMIPCLPGEIKQVILNIVLNAAYAIAEKRTNPNTPKGTLRVVTRMENPYAVVEIRDDGTGIRADIREKIFEPFFTTKGVGKGTGQGLAIAYDVIVNKHHGRIEVESEEGKGSAFILKIPLVQETREDDSEA